MRDVVVLGAGMTIFGKQPDRSIREMGEEAAFLALRDAGVKPGDIQAAWCGNVLGSLSGQQAAVGQTILEQVGVTGIPVLRVENACASASFAFKEAYMAVSSGYYDMVIAMGVEKMSGYDTATTLRAMAGTSDFDMEGVLGITFPGVFGMITRRHMHKYGTTMEQIAHVAVKNRSNGSLNPKSQFQGKVSINEVLHSRMVSSPLTLYNCCPISDGCAVVILTTDKVAKRYTSDPITVAASAQTSGTYQHDLDITEFQPTIRAAQQAYDQAGIGPEDVSLAEVHDCFTIAEIMHYEDLGFCKKGDGGILAENGDTQISGRIPVNSSGGLLSKGHPIGATGVAQIVELVEQLRGRAGARQVQNPRIGLAHCLGAFRHADVCSASVTLLKK
ncbi:MAG: thiolase domain-containing protein [Desulfobacterales bacterium]|nr:thiolase domain-containing protein [Deltaproteobacteria bacterium]NNL43599.1 thiolase domain-containing protein [Desulfobacterales bacterium]